MLNREEGVRLIGKILEQEREHDPSDEDSYIGRAAELGAALAELIDTLPSADVLEEYD
jgi:hypothetical protein